MGRDLSYTYSNSHDSDEDSSLTDELPSFYLSRHNQYLPCDAIWTKEDLLDQIETLVEICRNTDSVEVSEALTVFALLLHDFPENRTYLHLYYE